jgi:hypothetical protein
VYLFLLHLAEIFNFNFRIDDIYLISKKSRLDNSCAAFLGNTAGFIGVAKEDRLSKMV